MQTATLSDEELAQAVATGERDAFRPLIERLYPRIFQTSWRLLGNRLDAEDLAQDICVALPIKLRNWSKDIGFSHWLYMVIMNGTYDLRRRKADREYPIENWGDPYNPLQTNEAHTKQSTIRWLNEAMDCLPVDLRDTAVLVLGEDLSYASVGMIMGVGEDAIVWRMAEVKDRLRDLPPFEIELPPLDKE